MRGRRVVVAGVGMVGRRVARLLEPSVERRGDRLASMRGLELGSVAAGELHPGDLVVLTTGAPHATLATEILDRGASVVSVSDDLSDIRQLLELDDRARAGGAALVVGAAMSPGLSGLLLQHVATGIAQVDEVHVAVHATAGPACARQHHRALRGRSIGWHDGVWTERPSGSGRELCWFPEPVGARDCYSAELPDPLLLHRTHPDLARISARMSATRRDRLTARLPMLRPPHPEGGVGALRVEVRGADTSGARVVHVVGVAELVGTAAGATAAVMAEAVLDRTLPVGVVVTSDPELPTGELLARIERRGVRLQEFTGVPEHG